MIRQYATSDFERIVSIARETELAFKPGEIKERLEKWTSLVWDDSGTVEGVACWQKENDREFNLNIFVEPASRRQGIGSGLFDRSIEGIRSHGERGRITIRYRLDSGDSQRFFRNRDFVNWYSVDDLMYDGSRMPEPLLPPGAEIRSYEDRDFEEFISVMGDAFIPLRRFFDFRPHDVRELHKDASARERLLANKSDRFALLYEGAIMAMAEIKGNFIDTLGVTPAGRGRGFGKALMHHCMNVLRNRGFRVIETSVILGNIPAWRLYSTLGFRRIQITEWACRWI